MRFPPFIKNSFPEEKTVSSSSISGESDGDEFDAALYRELFPDLANLSDEDAHIHYKKHAFVEGRIPHGQSFKTYRAYVSSLDADFYRDFHPDLQNLSETEARHHYVFSGVREGRLANLDQFIESVEKENQSLPEDFDFNKYLALNPDLRSGIKTRYEAIAHYLRHGRWEGRTYKVGQIQTIYNLENLNRLTSNIYNMPQVVVDESRQPSINVLVPAFDFGSMSAGFFGVFQVARFLALKCGYGVRLVMFEAFDFDENDCRAKLKNYPGMENLFDETEIVYLGNRDKPLVVSRFDNCVATVWYSAYFARDIMVKIGLSKFLYLIQDYESVFYPSSAMFSLADATYDFDYFALFSSQALQEFFIRKKIGIFSRADVAHTYFNNACSSVLSSKEQFIASRCNGATRRLTFYSRPPVYRNMFELGALALCTAFEEGVFGDGDWEFIGIGLGNATIELGPDLVMRQMQRMNLSEYQTVISTFDIGLCLMASPHPSLLPFDLSGSGTVVVTNTFSNKDQVYFDSLTTGVITAEPSVPALVEALRRAVAMVDDLDTRYENARAMSFPRTWDETFTPAHAQLMQELFERTPKKPIGSH